MKTLSAQYSRYGDRSMRIFLRRQGMKLSWSCTAPHLALREPAVAQMAAQASHRGQQAHAVSALQGQHGVGLATDNGLEFVSMVILEWISQSGIGTVPFGRTAARAT